MECDFCKAAATIAVESIEGEDTAYLCFDHRSAFWTVDQVDWFEPEAVGAELDPRSGLPVAA